MRQQAAPTRILDADLPLIAEPFNDDGTWRQDVFFNTLGQGYIATALRAAKAADPNAKVYINDFNIEGTGTSPSLAPYQPSMQSDEPVGLTSQARKPLP